MNSSLTGLPLLSRWDRAVWRMCATASSVLIFIYIHLHYKRDVCKTADRTPPKVNKLLITFCVIIHLI